MNPFRIILAFTRMILLVLLMVFSLLLYLVWTIFFLFHNQKKAFALRRFYVYIANWIMGNSIQKSGKVALNGALYVCNHRSFSDPVVLSKYLNAYVIAKAEVADYPILNWGAKLTGVIYVKRDSSDSRKATRELLVKTIKSGNNVLVYPEGTTNGDMNVKTYRPGTFFEAAENDISVVPVVLEYKKEQALWANRGLFSQFLRQLGTLSMPVKLKIGPAFKNQDGEALRDDIENWTNQEITAMHKGWGSFFDQNKS